MNNQVCLIMHKEKFVEEELKKIKEELQNYKDFVVWFGVEDEFEVFLERVKEETVDA